MRRLKFKIEGVDVVFPYPYIYPEQYRYMLSLKRALDSRGPCVLEMPSGTGKTVSLLSLITSVQETGSVGRLFYCSRTVPEIEQTIEEARRVIAAQQEQRIQDGAAPVVRLAIAMSSRKNLCVNAGVREKKEGTKIDSACRDLTASWIPRDGSAPLCPLYEKFVADEVASSAAALSGVFSLGDLREHGTKNGICPYFLARRLANVANVVVFSYQYIVDPRISEIVALTTTPAAAAESVVVFDEAHNIDNVCIEALSANVDVETAEAASRNLAKLDSEVKRVRASDAEKLKREYARLVEGLARSGVRSDADELSHDPVLPDDVALEAVPGNIRKAEHFVAFLNRFVEYLKARLRATNTVQVESPFSFVHKLEHATAVDPEVLKFCSTRLGSLFRTLELKDAASFSPISLIADFGALLATYSDGFHVILEPSSGAHVPGASNAVIQFSCLDASIAFAPVVRKYRNVVITSGTMSPLDMYPRILQFRPILSERFSMSLSRQCILPMILSRGSDQVAITSRHAARDDPAVVRNYGNLLVEMTTVVPDGIVGFFPSYHYMEQTIASWNDMGLLNSIVANKLLFIETPDPVETSLALHNYKVACDCGRGAVLLAVARGKLSEGIDFQDQYGRCVILFGIPYVFTQSRVLKSRLEFLYQKCNIKEAEFLTFDAMRTASQCVGRAIRSKSDYAVMVFADKRFTRLDKRTKLPQWVSQFLAPSQMNLSTDVSVSLARGFFRRMGQPFSQEEQLGKSLWRLSDLPK